MAKKIILANNPKMDNSCQCFVHQVPSLDWLIISRFATMAECQKVIDQCSALFMGMPITPPKKKMMG